MANSNYIVQSLDRALNILEEVSTSDVELGVTELSKRVQLHKSTVHRLLATLVCRGYIEKNTESERYRLGLKVLDLAKNLSALGEFKKAHPALSELARCIRESVYLVIKDGNEG